MNRRTRIILLAVLWALAIAGVAAVIWQLPEEPSVNRDAPIILAGSTPARRGELQPLVELPPAEPTRFRSDRRNTGQSAYRGPAEANNRWKYTTGGSIVTQPVVSESGVIYVTSLDHHLYAIGATGDLRWRVDLGGPGFSTPTLDPEGNLYVGSDVGSFFSVTPGGEMRWSIVAEDDADTGSALSPAGDRLYFGAGHDLWAVNLDGTVAWRFRARGKIFSTPAIDDDGTIYFGAQDNYFYAIAPNGHPYWEMRTGDDNDGTPALSRATGYIYFGSDDGSVYAVARSGERKWATEVGGYVRSPIAVHPDGFILAGVVGSSPRVVALDAGSGDEVWSLAVRPGDPERGVVSGAVIDCDGNIYVGAFDGFLYSITRTGGLRWVLQAEGPIDGTPIIGGDETLYVGADDGMLYAVTTSLDASSGRE